MLLFEVIDLDKCVGWVGSGRVVGNDYSYFVGWIGLGQSSDVIRKGHGTIAPPQTAV